MKTYCRTHEAGACYEGCPDAYDLDVDREHESAKVVDRYRDDLLSGRTLALHAASARSALGYRPPIRHEDWATAMERIARMARSSERLAAIARSIFGKVNLYGTDGQAQAAVYEAALHATSKPYLDVVGLAGPEPGRRSDRTHEWTLRDRVALAYWLEYATRPFASTTPGVGWTLSIVAETIGYVPPAETTEYLRERERAAAAEKARWDARTGRS